MFVFLKLFIRSIVEDRLHDEGQIFNVVTVGVLGWAIFCLKNAPVYRRTRERKGSRKREKRERESIMYERYNILLHLQLYRSP